jgi:hypothetical protein
VEKLYREETLEVLLCEEWEFYYFAQWFIQSLGNFINYSCSDLVYYYFLSSSLAKKKIITPAMEARYRFNMTPLAPSQL